MARPKKIGLDYYNVDTSLFLDVKIKKLIHSCGTDGLAVYLLLVNECYRDKGCFIVWDSKSTAFNVADTLRLKESAVNEVINYCCAVGLFERELLTSENVITSLGIQKRYAEICKQIKREVLIPDKICLINFNSGENSVNSGENPFNSGENSVFDGDNPTKKRKEKEIKENEKKINNENHLIFGSQFSILGKSAYNEFPNSSYDEEVRRDYVSNSKLSESEYQKHYKSFYDKLGHEYKSMGAFKTHFRNYLNLKLKDNPVKQNSATHVLKFK